MIFQYFLRILFLFTFLVLNNWKHFKLFNLRRYKEGLRNRALISRCNALLCVPPDSSSLEDNICAHFIRKTFLMTPYSGDLIVPIVNPISWPWCTSAPKLPLGFAFRVSIYSAWLSVPILRVRQMNTESKNSNLSKHVLEKKHIFMLPAGLSWLSLWRLQLAGSKLAQEDKNKNNLFEFKSILVRVAITSWLTQSRNFYIS